MAGNADGTIVGQAPSGVSADDRPERKHRLEIAIYCGPFLATYAACAPSLSLVALGPSVDDAARTVERYVYDFVDEAPTMYERPTGDLAEAVSHAGRSTVYTLRAFAAVAEQALHDLGAWQERVVRFAGWERRLLCVPFEPAARLSGNGFHNMNGKVSGRHAAIENATEEQPAVPASTAEADFQQARTYFEEHVPEWLSKHAGEYVAIIGDHVIARDRDLGTVTNEAYRASRQRPIFIDKIAPRHRMSVPVVLK